MASFLATFCFWTESGPALFKLLYMDVLFKEQDLWKKTGSVLSLAFQAVFWVSLITEG